MEYLFSVNCKSFLTFRIVIQHMIKQSWKKWSFLHTFPCPWPVGPLLLGRSHSIIMLTKKAKASKDTTGPSKKN